MFAFLMAVYIQRHSGMITEAEWQFLLGHFEVDYVSHSHDDHHQKTKDKPHVDWVTPQMWDRICRLDRLFDGLALSFTSFLPEWRQFIESEESAISVLLFLFSFLS
jgi:hypothetical protein